MKAKLFRLATMLPLAAALTLSAATMAEARSITVRECIFTIGQWCPFESVLMWAVLAAIFGGTIFGGGIFYAIRRMLRPRTKEEALRRIDDVLARAERDWRFYVERYRRQSLTTLLRLFVPNQIEHMRDDLPGFVEHVGEDAVGNMIIEHLRRSGSHPEAEFDSAAEQFFRIASP
jgi:hypothetical protein